MTVLSDLQKCKAIALQAQGTYETFEQATQDPTAKQMFKDLANDMQRHVQVLDNRIQYLKHTNELNYEQQKQQQ